MDYKKEYEEMVQRVKELHETGNALTKTQMEIICPELRESEDERIRRKMIEHFKSKTKETWCNMPVKDIIAYLEKQKDRLAPIYEDIDSFESALEKAWKDYDEGQRKVDSFEDDYVECAHAKGFREGYLFGLEKQKKKKTDAKSERVIQAARRVLNNWLDGTDRPDVSGDFAELEYAIREYDGEEKQKENPKSTDSIPADCVSDAKCEDRWHKVQDSLPDNGRLVLAQDCLGNTLLARYYGEGNWEVSAYDNEDYYCWNTITKWCEIPSEKQKEQKPAEWSEEDEENLGKLHRLLVICQGEKKFIPSDEYDKLDNWLKSLRKD